MVRSSSKGFTLVELLLVVAIVSLLAASSAPFLSRFILLNNLEVAESRTVSTLRKAQEYAMDNKNDAMWGVCVTGTQLRLFRGTCLSPSYNEDFDFSGITISGFTQVAFSNERGEPSSAVTMTLTNSIGTRTISINAGGGMTIQ